jgi:cytochrome P450
MSTPLTLKARHVATSLVERVPSPGDRPLAEPPAGSGLAPVMGDPGLPIVGHTLGFLEDTLASTRRFHERFGTVFWANAFGTRLVLVVGPDGTETVLANRDRAFASKDGWEHFIGPFFERGVMLMDFEEHRHHRRIMQQAFKRERLVAYLDAMNPAIERGIASWRPGSGFELYTATKQLTLDIATEVFVGGELGDEADCLNEAFIDVVHGGQAIVRADVPGGKWHRGLGSRRLLEQYFRSQLPAKRASNAADLFSVLCRAQTEDG